MVKIEPFEVEQWMDRYETTPGVLNIAETCVASVSIRDLVNLSTKGHKENGTNVLSEPLQLSRKLTYGEIRGSATLRERVAAAHYGSDADADAATPLPPDNVLITQGAIVANFLLFYTLVGPGDHVICVHPTYQQLYAVPASLGAEVSLWRLKKDNGYVPDPNELAGLVRDNTKMIVLNNPNNPTGATIPKSVLSAIVDFARPRGIIVFCDEVYQPLFHSLPDDDETPSTPPPSILSLGYDRTVSTGSMSKAYSLAGIRVGWLASRDPSIVAAAAAARDYTTISVSQLDDQVAAYALSDAVRPALVARNLRLARDNASMLRSWVGAHEAVCEWVEPTAGTTAFVRFSDSTGEPVDDERFCLDVLEKTKVMFLPGSRCFGSGEGDFRGFVRFGYVCETDVLKEALEKLGRYVEENLEKV